MIDSHCHLDAKAYGDDAAVDEVVARARAAGVERMVTVGSGYGFDSAARALATARRHPDCLRATVGLHPHDAKDFTDESFADLLAMAASPAVVALGEMGLDFHYDNSPRDVQRAVFREQIRAARGLRLPIVVHDRDSDGETTRILDEEAAWDTGVLFHCYTGDVAMMEAIVSRGGLVSIPGIVTFKNADVMRAVAAAVPEDRFLIETDSPFLAPIPHRGKKNEPAYVTLVAAKIAELRGSTAAEVGAVAAANTRRLFGWA
ncbi:MAG: TatD family hydrolase [Myxococcota bacterium]